MADKRRARPEIMFRNDTHMIVARRRVTIATPRNGDDPKSSHCSGSQSRTRTCNLAINSRLLCQLSYLGMHPKATQH